MTGDAFWGLVKIAGGTEREVSNWAPIVLNPCVSGIEAILSSREGAKKD